MFKSQENKEERAGGSGETVIGESVRVKGNFHGQGGMVIEGTVEGSVKTDGRLLVGQKARITADVQAGSARVAGEINGNVIISGFLELAASARVIGDIRAEELAIERGATLVGRCDMKDSKEEAANGAE